jgi:phospholipase/carboxylesterase
MKNESTVVEIGGLTVRQRLPSGPSSPRLMLMLHGWTGDENSMWIFASRIPDNYLILAPRGITRPALGGYGWENQGTIGWPAADDLQDSVNALFELIHSYEYPGLEKARFSLMGFSQGAALGYTILLKYPERIRKLAGISGFLPAGLEEYAADRRLAGKLVFVSHGTKDKMVPVERSREVVEGLKSAGADVIYCEEDVGHKLSSGCFRAMDDYFQDE